MANFIPSEKKASDFNNGVAYVGENKALGITGDAVKAETINNLIESILWLQENMGSISSGLFAIPISLSSISAGQITVEEYNYIAQNIGTIRKGAYISLDNGRITYLVVSASTSNIVALSSTNLVNISLTDRSITTTALGGGTSGLFEIPYDLTELKSGSEGVDFIIEHIEEIKKGAYFVIGGSNALINAVSDYGDAIYIIFDINSIALSDNTYKYSVGINVALKKVEVHYDQIDGADFYDYPQLMVGKRIGDGNTRIYGDYALNASPENEGKVIGIKDGQFVAMDMPTGVANPIVANTNTEMSDLLNENNIGKVVKYAGDTNGYQKDGLYLIEEDK